VKLHEMYPLALLEEFRRLARLPFPWATIEQEERPNFRIEFHAPTWLRKIVASGADGSSFIASVAQFKEGHKVVKVTEAQYTALANVDVNLELADFAMPFPTMTVVLPPGHLHRCCLVHRYSPDVLICSSMSTDNLDDITTVVRQAPGEFIEASLEKYDDDLLNVAERSTQTLRVSLNMLLALTNFGFRTDLLYPKDAENDRGLTKEDSERGRKARIRLKEQPRLVQFDREVVLHRSEGSHGIVGTGREASFHWRRGHWRAQAHGPKMSLRKRIFVAPVMVRADLLAGAEADVSVVYRSK
jgi:hypothetical protein